MFGVWGSTLNSAEAQHFFFSLSLSFFFFLNSGRKEAKKNNMTAYLWEVFDYSKGRGAD